MLELSREFAIANLIGRGQADAVECETRGGSCAPDDDEPVVLDPAMEGIHRIARRVARSDISVLLLAETGSGKEILAETIHRLSQRKELLRLNCAALSENLLESELFGHEKGSFSGATQSKPGLLEMVDGGTAFLDEIGEMPPSLQAKLLRVIEEKKVTRVGGLRPRDINVRFVAATNRNLAAEVARGAFRADLYYRLNGITFKIPPLRQRPSEVLPLALMFLKRAATLARRRVPTLTSEARARLMAHTWPGNIRELRNVIERAVAISDDDDMITIAHLHIEEPLEATIAPPPPSSDVTHEARFSNDMPLTASSSNTELQRINDALAKCAGNQSAAAKLLGISRTTLASRLTKYNIPRPRSPRRTD